MARSIARHVALAPPGAALCGAAGGRRRRQPAPTGPLRPGLVALVSVLVWAVACPWCGRSGAAAAPGEAPGHDNDTAPIRRQANDRPNGEVGFTLDQCAKAELALAKRLREAYPVSDEAWASLAALHKDQGRATAAAKCWEQVLLLNPRRADAYRELGGLAREQGQVEQAIAYWRKGLQLAPQSLDLRIRVAQALLVQGTPQEAVTQLRQGLGAEPKVGPWHYLMGEGHLKLHDYDRAKSYYERAIALDPQDASSYYGLFTACLRLGKEDDARKYAAVFRTLKDEERNRASEYATRMRNQQAENAPAAAADPALPERQRETDRLIGKYTAAKRRFDTRAGESQTEESFLRALGLLDLIGKLNPHDPTPHVNAGIMQGELGHWRQAEASFRKAIEIAPEYDAGYRHLARSFLMTKKNLAEARKLAETAVGLTGSAENHFALAWACYMNGDKERALQAVEQAVILAPDNATYRQLIRRLREDK